MASDETATPTAPAGSPERACPGWGRYGPAWECTAWSVLLGFAVLGVVLSPWRPLLLVLVGPAVAAGVLVVVATTRGAWTSAVVVHAVGVTTLGVCALIGAGHELAWAGAAAGCLGASAPGTWHWISGRPTTHPAHR